MSYLGIALQRIAQENDLSQSEIVRRAQWDKASMSRTFGGDRAPDNKEFAELVAVIAKTPRQRAELVAARCEDMRNGPGSEMVEILVRGKPIEQAPPSAIKLPQKYEKVMEFLRGEIINRPTLGDFLTDYARQIGMK